MMQTIWCGKRWLLYPLLLLLLIQHSNVSAYNGLKGRTTLSPPVGLKIVQVTDTSVTLTWSPTSKRTKSETYWIYKNARVHQTTSETTITISGLTPAKRYLFTLKARDVLGRHSRLSKSILVTTKSPVMIGYYGSWSAYHGRTIANLDASKLTHLNYAFATIDSSFKIQLSDPFIDVEKRFPGDSVQDPYFGNLNQLRKLKVKYPHLKTLISVGGWSGSARFSDAALTAARRNAFADSCVAFVVNYGFDGIDIDWEYPVAGGEAGNIKRPQDKTNFTLLMKTLRAKLDAQSKRDGKKYWLTFAGAAGQQYVNNVELSKLQQLSDYVNLMSYDIHGIWDRKTGMNAPLYKDQSSGSSYATSVHDAVQLYLQQGVPASKLVMGIPFYGYRYDQVTSTGKGLYQPFHGGASLTYSQIKNKYLNQGYTRYFNEISKVPYLFNGQSMISYDDPESITYKAEYIKKQGLAGAMIWELTQDSSTRELLQALYQGLQ